MTTRAVALRPGRWNMARLETNDWVEVHQHDATVVSGRAIVPVTCTLTDAFYAFASALLYSAHKYYPGLL